MKIAIVETKKGDIVINKSMNVALRTAQMLSTILNADFIYRSRDVCVAANDYDIIILPYISTKSEHFLVQDFMLRNKNAKIIQLLTEYELVESYDLYYTQLPFYVIRQYEGDLRLRTHGRLLGDYQVHLNCLIDREPNELQSKKHDCIYYGRWRDGRKQYYRRYIQGISLSTHIKNLKRYILNGCHPNQCYSSLDWGKGHETLNDFRYSLYIEDEYTHTHYNYLANRWYEAGFCNNVVFFDANCENTIKRSEIGYYWEQIKDYIVHDAEELHERIEHCNTEFEKHLAIQKCWRTNAMVIREQEIKRLKDVIELIANS